ncbi:carbamoyl-phosphate synthase small subunit [Natronocella acetinitrilica]|uniref:Carbamoyl phosphate synthase small chain n=1 Tax=Natronocella acetinitrilica TaxID=414046 RepID=A0AAE3KCA6_9GAMM|nr:glutamine-hydrolyzing carbamoyl-phosphate synthase small subunit [Natronocella acetinitrilica]MCP1674718.1 carbamoyl-phosphate synthase small subunit [Natronocella acetinitrilica]
MNTPAILALADGSVFRGEAIGVEGAAVGEVVFNTAMTGYQEICTDPSYSRQLVTLTYPHVGNTGTTPLDNESDGAQLAGLIIRDLPLRASNWRNTQTLDAWLAEQGVVAIAGIDTRRLTRLLREKGAQSGCIMAGTVDEAAAIEQARGFPGLKGMDLAQHVSTQKQYDWRRGGWQLDDGLSDGSEKADSDLPWHVVAYDFGIKQNILRMLVDHGCRVTVVPARTPAQQVLAMQPSGVFFSNGPGDPEPCDYAIKAIAEIVDSGVPSFGICLGHQLLGLASGARTIKMKFGHHGANHPVLDVETGRVMISSQNHGFAVDEQSLPSTLRTTHRSLFDDSLQGIHRTDRPAFGFQGHPEASPGPHDVRPLFAHFVELMREHRA